MADSGPRRKDTKQRRSTLRVRRDVTLPAVQPVVPTSAFRLMVNGLFGENYGACLPYSLGILTGDTNPDFIGLLDLGDALVRSLLHPIGDAALLRLRGVEVDMGDTLAVLTAEEAATVDWLKSCIEPTLGSQVGLTIARGYCVANKSAGCETAPEYGSVRVEFQGALPVGAEQPLRLSNGAVARLLFGEPLGGQPLTVSAEIDSVALDLMGQRLLGVLLPPGDGANEVLAASNRALRASALAAPNGELLH